ncbi:hypothetical protein SAMN05421538_11317 [Paracoccus isoporae]|uniref:Uncharacterized protein n=1 Tax=Paracoccus isoporae TaxID=591205 RepID=A0A1G7GDY8_9RHOB|nr:hypothetical protein SAMN05421538_11317 [Paracoccus isoporae]
MSQQIWGRNRGNALSFHGAAGRLAPSARATGTALGAAAAGAARDVADPVRAWRSQPKIKRNNPKTPISRPDSHTVWGRSMTGEILMFG